MRSALYPSLCFIIIFSSSADAHEGHSHSSPSVGTSRANAGGIEVQDESPMSASLKVRSGYEQGQYLGFLSGLNSYWGDNELNLKLGYEYRYREFKREESSLLSDRDNDHHVTAIAKKALTNYAQLVLVGEYEENKAIRIKRAINDFAYYSINPNLSFQLEQDWTVSAGYAFGYRKFPNGTYVIPGTSASGIGEPITPGEQRPDESEVTKHGVEDAQHEVIGTIAKNMGPLTVNLEGRYILSYSNQKTREYNGQSARLGVDRNLWKRASGQISQLVENQKNTERNDQIYITEMGLLQELSSRMSALAFARYNQTYTTLQNSWWEGYAQLQYVF